jgi:hypothetical protein
LLIGLLELSIGFKWLQDCEELLEGNLQILKQGSQLWEFLVYHLLPEGFGFDFLEKGPQVLLIVKLLVGEEAVS